MNSYRHSKAGQEVHPVQLSHTDSRSHWNKVYETKPIEKLGWYEDKADPSLYLIEKCKLQQSSAILHVGAGATTLIDTLETLGYVNLYVNDISHVALEKLKARLGNGGSSIQWIEDDLTNPHQLNNIKNVELWHDRAVLHFFTQQKDQEAYFQLLKSVVAKGGYVIIAVFNLEGALHCSGLPVFRYSEAMLSDRLGEQFSLIESFDHMYTMPSGNTRSYIYTLYQRK